MNYSLIMPSRILSAAIALLLLPVFAFSEDKADIRLNHITIENGLPNSSVSSILQDQNGFMWFGTQGGLARYDGYKFTVFNQDPFIQNSLNHNLVQTLSLDEDGSLWIGTYAGINHLDPLTGRFTHFDGTDAGSVLSNKVVTAILMDSRRRLWAGTLDGLNRLRKDNTFEQYFHEEADASSLGSSAVRAIEEDRKGRLWFGTYAGLSLYSEDTDSFINYFDSAVMVIKEDPVNDSLWLGTWDGRIIRFNPDDQSSIEYTLGGQNIYSLEFDNDGRLWIGSWGTGLSILDPKSGEITGYTNQTTPDLSNNVIYSLWQDRSGVMWIGTNGGGINTYSKWNNRFEFIENRSDDPDSLSPGQIYCLFEDDKGTIWAGTKGGGLNRINKETGEIHRYGWDSEDPFSLSDNTVNAVVQDLNGRLWVATNNGFCLYRPESDDFKRFFHPLEPDSPSLNIIYRMYSDNEGRLWLGTYNEGLIIFDPDTGNYELYPHDIDDEESISSNLIRDFMPVQNGTVWIATNNGINIFDPEKEKFNRVAPAIQNPESNNDIRTLFQDERGRIWSGSMGGGIRIYTDENDDFNYLTRRNGLLSNSIIDIEQSGAKNIWIAEQNGISIQDAATGEFRHLTSSSGLHREELTSNILFASDGFVWIGGDRGITKIPNTLSDENDYLPQIRITRLEINGDSYLNAGEVLNSGSITLSHTQKNLNIELNCDDYTYPENNLFTYKLEGFDREWSTSNERNFISYTNLPAGHYIFRARGAGSRNNWSANEIRLELTLKHHPAVTPLAIFSYIAAFAVIIWLVLITIIRGKKREEEKVAEQLRINRLLEERVRQRTIEIEDAKHIAEEATRAKSLFLANMSHELRTPLSGIIGMLDLIKKTGSDPEQQQYIDYSMISAENLLGLLDDILNFEKLNSGKDIPVSEVFSPHEIINYIQTLYSKEIAGKNINFIVDVDDNVPAFLKGDGQKLSQIISNLISNSSKYTEKGFIRLKLSGEAENELFKAEINISDSGIGIPGDKLNSVFNSFEQIDSSYTKTGKGVGLGLAIVDRLVKILGGSIELQSRPGEGTEFSIRLSFAIADAAEAPDADYPPEKQKSADNLKVLFAEDEAINKLYVTKLLSELGCSFESCSNGREAIEKYGEFRPHIVLMDIGMPEVNGVEAVERIREYESSHGCRAVIIMLSAHVYKDDIEKCRKAGADDFLSKPFNEQEFNSCINKWSALT